MSVVGRLGYVAWFQKVPLAGVILFASALVACGGGGDDNNEGSATASPRQSVAAQIVSADLGVGPNRFSVGLVDQAQGQPVLDAENVNLRFFKVLAGDQAQLRSETLAQAVRFEKSYIDERTKEKVSTGEIAVYVAEAEFDEAGDWGVEITAQVDGQMIEPQRLAFQVLEADQVLSIGDPAPRSRQALASDVADQSEIDSMQPPDPLHDLTVADAIAAGRPTVVLFGTPAFCETQVCAPIMDTIMLPLYEQYGGQVAFMHIEPYLLEQARAGEGFCAVPVFNREFAAQGIGEGTGECPVVPADQLPPPEESWNLTVEPIVFVIDQQGIIAGKFDGPAGPDEVEAVLQAVLGGT